ncbi:uncharacterized protein LOC130715105 [Lotus japonicus]|uniref:Uncharacterized protein n=1 Tax=Lotus japonicus TaxID=34305 RepID=I3SHT5_LOTJA|nr:uncharacterized protein LOC130715105 [Lotus japonicus]AFK39827.1 unknown [Lotus japonicus]
MNCLVLPVSLIRRRFTRYYPLTKDDDQDLDKELESHKAVTVAVGREKRVFLVDPFILQENQFRILMDHTSMKMDQGDKEDHHHHLGFSTKQHGVVFVDVDTILFQHMLWLVHNDYSSLCNLNLKEIIDFYAHDAVW